MTEAISFRTNLGIISGSTLAVTASVALAVLIYKFGGYEALFKAQPYALLGTMTVGGAAFTTFAISSVKRMREKQIIEDNTPPLGLAMAELLKQYPLLKEDIEALSYECVALIDSYKALAEMVKGLKEKNVPAEVAATVIALVGALLLDPRQAEKLNGKDSGRDFAQEFFDIVVKTNDPQFIKLFLGPIEDKIALQRFLNSIQSFGNQKIALLFLEKLQTDGHQFGFLPQDFTSFFYLGWNETIIKLFNMFSFEHLKDRISHQLYRGYYIQKKLLNGRYEPNDSCEANRLLQIQISNYRAIRGFMLVKDALCQSNFLDFSKDGPLDFANGRFEQEIELELRRLNFQSANWGDIRASIDFVESFVIS